MKKLIFIAAFFCLIACSDKPETQVLNVAQVNKISQIKNVNSVAIFYYANIQYGLPDWHIHVELKTKCGELTVKEEGHTLDKAVDKVILKINCLL